MRSSEDCFGAVSRAGLAAGLIRSAITGRCLTSAGDDALRAYLKPAAVGTTQAGDGFGRSVSVSGDTAVVGAGGEDSSTTGMNSTPNESATDSGAAYVFVRSAGVWTQQAYLKPATVGTTEALEQLIALKLDSWVNSPTRRLKDKSDVIELIKLLKLPRDIAINKSVSQLYVEAWDALQADPE